MSRWPMLLLCLSLFCCKKKKEEDTSHDPKAASCALKKLKVIESNGLVSDLWEYVYSTDGVLKAKGPDTAPENYRVEPSKTGKGAFLYFNEPGKGVDTTTFHFDGKGKIDTMVRYGIYPVTTVFSHDSNGKILSYTAIHDTSLAFTAKFYYDTHDNVTQMVEGVISNNELNGDSSIIYYYAYYPDILNPFRQDQSISLYGFGVNGFYTKFMGISSQHALKSICRLQEGKLDTLNTYSYQVNANKFPTEMHIRTLPSSANVSEHFLLEYMCK